MYGLVSLICCVVVMTSLASAAVNEEKLQICVKDAGLTPAQIAFVRANRTDTTDEHIKYSIWCYYTTLYIFTGPGGFTEEKYRIAFARQWSIFDYKTIMAKVDNCKQVANNNPDKVEMKEWTFHKCLIQNGLGF